MTYDSVMPELIIYQTTTESTATSIRISSRRCCSSTELLKQRKRNLIKMYMGLEGIPEGYPEVHTLNLGYNNIDQLSAFVFWNNSYTGVRKLYLQQNRIHHVSVNAFKGIRQVRQIDLSDNLITDFDPYTFKSNNRLQKLIVMNNLITFNRLQTFLLSHSIEYLVLSNNKIDQIYEMTFLGVPNLKSLVLNDNEIFGVSPNSFRTLDKLHYLSLANTGVHRLGESMFSRIPRTLNIEGTPLGLRFEPPLKKVTGESVARLLSLSRLMLEENYFDNPN
ncbi:hypothetical protein ILUMI_27075 [Ignelater luminosus]|uniref:Uncharacterized protein n=1 Tax=Ignelater luminosus TaxID=2038154 RepID=A0A8K0C3T0_IGNLU|nr:hypothetical protein ILUMI_27075 [Ignelater luminosus]